MDFVNEAVIDPLSAFVNNSRMLVTRCQKPNYTQFVASATATAVGFLVMGFLGLFGA